MVHFFFMVLNSKKGTYINPVGALFHKIFQGFRLLKGLSFDQRLKDEISFVTPEGSFGGSCPSPKCFELEETHSQPIFRTHHKILRAKEIRETSPSRAQEDKAEWTWTQV